MNTCFLQIPPGQGRFDLLSISYSKFALFFLNTRHLRLYLIKHPFDKNLIQFFFLSSEDKILVENLLIKPEGASSPFCYYLILANFFL